MIPKKIKTIRELLGITETQVSNTIHVNCYKYKRSEEDIAYVSTEMLILLSIIYKMPFEKFLLEKYTIDDIVKENYLNKLKELERNQVEIILKDNLCSYFSFEKIKANSTTINKILKNEKKLFYDNLKAIIENNELDTAQIVDILGVNIISESRTKMPTPTRILDFSRKFNVELSSLIISPK